MTVCVVGHFSTTRRVWDRLWAWWSDPRARYASQDCRRPAFGHSRQQDGWSHSGVGGSEVILI